jgi:LPXTG-motif cell wall-anchored protein
MALVVGAIMGVVGLSATQGLAFTGPVATPNTSDSNKASYWGPGCTKLDTGNGGVSWVADGSYDIVVLKSGTTDYAFYDVVAGDVLQIPQDISHFIFCPPTTTTTTTTTTSTTTSTTTVPDETTTTTVPDETTTTTAVGQQGPTTTAPEETTTTTAAVGQQGPTTTVTASGAVTTTLPTQLPSTGSELQLAVLGGVLMASGVTLLTVSRRRTV